MKVCLSCGQVAENTDAFCPRCGKSLPVGGPLPPTPGYVYPPPTPPGPNPDETPSIRMFRTACRFGMIAFLISTATSVIGVVYLRRLLTITGSGHTVTVDPSLIPYVWAVTGIEAVSLAVLIVSFVYFRRAFAGWEPRASTFSTPRAGSFLGIVGAAILIPACLLTANYASGFLHCLGQAGTTAASCFAANQIYAPFGLALVAGFLLFVGLIGTLVGV